MIRRIISNYGIHVPNNMQRKQQMNQLEHNGNVTMKIGKIFFFAFAWHYYNRMFRFLILLDIDRLLSRLHQG